MKQLIGILLAVCFLAILVPDPAASASAVGLWATEGGKSHVRIAPCGKALCGNIVWLKEPLNDQGKPKVDSENPDEELKKRPILGLKLLNGFLPDEDEAQHWVDGEIYNPEDGETYSCTMTLQEDGSLKVRGYVGLPLFGKTQIWTPVKK